MQVWPGFFLNGLELESHTTATIETGGDLGLTLTSPEAVGITAKLQRGGQDVPGEMAFAQREDRRVHVYCLFPQPGTYTLLIFARPLASEGDYDEAIEYRVHATEACQAGASCPLVYDAFRQAGACLVAPLYGCLEAGTQEQFDLTVPGATDVVVISGGAWTRLTANGDRDDGVADIAVGKVTVCAQFPGKDGYSGVAEYEAE